MVSLLPASLYRPPKCPSLMGVLRNEFREIAGLRLIGKLMCWFPGAVGFETLAPSGGKECAPRGTSQPVSVGNGCYYGVHASANNKMKLVSLTQCLCVQSLILSHRL